MLRGQNAFISLERDPFPCVLPWQRRRGEWPVRGDLEIHRTRGGGCERPPPCSVLPDYHRGEFLEVSESAAVPRLGRCGPRNGRVGRDYVHCRVRIDG